MGKNRNKNRNNGGRRSQSFGGGNQSRHDRGTKSFGGGFNNDSYFGGGFKMKQSKY